MANRTARVNNQGFFIPPPPIFGNRMQDGMYVVRNGSVVGYQPDNYGGGGCQGGSCGYHNNYVDPRAYDPRYYAPQPQVSYAPQQTSRGGGGGGILAGLLAGMFLPGLMWNMFMPWHGWGWGGWGGWGWGGWGWC